MNVPEEPVQSNKYEELLEPKLPPINLWVLVPAYIFYKRKEDMHEAICCGKGCDNCADPSADVDFVVYGKSVCGPCTQVKRLLTSSGYRIHYKDIYQSREDMEFLQEQGIRAVPAVFKDGIYVGNYHDVLDMIKDR